MQITTGEKYLYKRENGQLETLVAIEKDGELYFLTENENYIHADNINFEFIHPTQTELSFGQTPWDNLSKEELLTEVQRMYSALNSAYTVLKMDKIRADLTGDGTEYYGPDGLGGAAYEKTRQIVEDVETKFSKDSIYRSFFRFADDFLFEKNGYHLIGSGWVVCDKCGLMSAVLESELKDVINKSCKGFNELSDCDGIIERLSAKHISK